MELLNNYLLASSQPQAVSIKKGKSGGTYKIEELPKVYKKRSSSLISIYSSKFKEITSPLASSRTIKNNQSSSDKIDSPKNKNTITSLIIKNKNSKIVDKSINAVNEYAEQLRMTLVSEYKIQKKRTSCSPKNNYLNDTFSAKAIKQLECLKQMPPPPKIHNETISNHSSKDMAFKTLNLLYKAIIDNSFHKRKKEVFELQAYKLPIVNRFNSNEKKQKNIDPKLNQQLNQDGAQKSHVLQRTSPTVAIVRRTKQALQPLKLIHFQQQLEIIPWSTSQQLML